MITDVISKPVYQVISDLTQESRVEIALPLAIKDLVRLKLKETSEQRLVFEHQYAMTFSEFQQAWETDVIPNKYSYTVEQDYWEWEATITDEQRLLKMLERLA